MPTIVSHLNSSKLLIQLGDGASPETFAHPCMINTARGIEFSSSPSESMVPYCPPDEDLPAWVDREIDALTAAINGAGIFDSLSHDIFRVWYLSGASKNIRVKLDLTVAGDSPFSAEAGYYQGAWVLQGFSITGPGRREKVTFDCSILSDGPITWVDAS